MTAVNLILLYFSCFIFQKGYWLKKKVSRLISKNNFKIHPS